MSKERVVIQVKGAKYETLTSTLEYFPNTLLGCEEKRRNYQNQNTGAYEFDTTAQIFDAVLFFYQSKGVLSKPEFVEPEDFWKAVVFFEIGRIVDRSPILPTNKWKRSIWIVLEHPELSLAGKILAFLTIIIVLGSVAVFCLETLYIPGPSTEIMIDEWFYCEVVVNGFFTLDYILRLSSSVSAWQYFKSGMGIIDLGCIVPFYLLLSLWNAKNSDIGLRALSAVRGLRLLKVLRIFKFIRYNRSLRNQAYAIIKSGKHIVLLLLLFVMAVLFFSALTHAFEYPGNKDFDNIAATSWFVVISMTSVGYGDMVPTTVIGKVITSVTILAGQVLIFYLFLPIYSNFFQEYFDDANKDKYELFQLADLKTLRNGENDFPQGKDDRITL